VALLWGRGPVVGRKGANASMDDFECTDAPASRLVPDRGLRTDTCQLSWSACPELVYGLIRGPFRVPRARQTCPIGIKAVISLFNNLREKGGRCFFSIISDG